MNVRAMLCISHPIHLKHCWIRGWTTTVFTAASALWSVPPFGSQFRRCGSAVPAVFTLEIALEARGRTLSLPESPYFVVCLHLANCALTLRLWPHLDCFANLTGGGGGGGAAAAAAAAAAAHRSTTTTPRL